MYIKKIHVFLIIDWNNALNFNIGKRKIVKLIGDSGHRDNFVTGRCPSALRFIISIKCQSVKCVIP